MNASDNGATVCVHSSYRYVSRRLIKPQPESSGAGAFRIIIDGHIEGVVIAAGSKVLPISPGKHSIRINFRWCSSRKIDFDVSPAESVVFTVGIPKTLNSALWLLFLPRRSRSLEQT